jgi:AraC-like DNA-binding protein
MTACTIDARQASERSRWHDSGLRDSAGGEPATQDDDLFNVLRLSLVHGIPAAALRPDLKLTALIGYCRDNLCDPDLSPHTVAAHFGISVRTLHLRFAQVGQTFGRWLLARRLEACRAALRDPGQQGASIAEIAYRCGFNDLSHFCKVFRTRFGETPRACRSGLAVTAGRDRHPADSGRSARRG